MTDLGHLVGWLPLAWATVVACVSLEAARRAFQRPSEACPPRPDAAQPTPVSALQVLLVRPCAGHEPHLDRALRSLCEARTSATLRCTFAVESDDDEAAPAARAAVQALISAGIPSCLVNTAQGTATPRAFAPNRKAAQIAAVVAAERQPFDVLLIADSDVDLAGLDLDTLLAPLSGPHPAAAAWAPPAEFAPPHTLADRASAALLGGSLHAFPLLAGLDPGSLVGKLCALRADALHRIGGFDALTAHLGEDMELGRRLRAQGSAIRVAPLVAPSLASHRSIPAIVSRYARWLTVIRAQRPLLLASYPALFAATPLIVLLALLTASATATAPATTATVSWPALAAIALALGARLLTAFAAARAAGRPTSLRTAIADALLADLLLLAAFTRALVSRKVVWRSAVLTVDRRGLLREAEA
ncbi:glycosyltransferase [Chondromyces apiculatus]|uniref:Glycosyltransferase probably involved in cell wall biogenesis-like protein n=1 Tax=Chondromyces apiculatus DSM 436 TaxID=1192034 RepID=A0A017T3G4_9BACT|nr:glycosyltransferase [Chondromyces apiculatus]EYF03788.1 Glycosyltransferase probably involved in cell wall biogenesis-like protein [Chondromyces apiculatus DSM 436]